MHLSARPSLLALSAGTLLLGACASGGDSTSNDTLPPVAAETLGSESVAKFDAADVTFAQEMIPHHRGAVAMAELALRPEADASTEVSALASRIKDAQDPEIEQMTTLLEAWGQPLEMAEMGSDGDMRSMGGMMSEQDMEALVSLSGPEFDLAWASAMIVHHEGAVSMAESVKMSGSNPEVLTLADAIIAAQQAEIEQMRAFTAG